MVEVCLALGNIETLKALADLLLYRLMITGNRRPCITSSGRSWLHSLPQINWHHQKIQYHIMLTFEYQQWRKLRADLQLAIDS